MNILTKISIVVLVVLVLLASAVFINLATSGPNYRDAYQAEKIAKNTAEMMANQKELTLQRANKDVETLTAERNKLLNDIATVRQALEADLQKAEIKNLEQERQINSYKRETTELRLMAASNADQAKLFYSQFEKTNTKLNDREAELRALSQKFQETDAALQRQEKQVYNLTEEKNELLAQITKMRSIAGAGAAPSGTGGSQVPAAEYTGTITTVRNGLASINIGSANGVKIDDQLIIYRGDKFIGNLKIELVNPNDAAGTIINKSPTSDPAQGDKVTSKMSLTGNTGSM